MRFPCHIDCPRYRLFTKIGHIKSLPEIQLRAAILAHRMFHHLRTAVIYNDFIHASSPTFQDIPPFAPPALRGSHNEAFHN